MALVFLLPLPLLVWSLRRLPGRSAAFLLCATWLRLLLAALHPYTYPPIAAGLSLNALGSIVAVMVGVLLLDLRLWRLKRLWTLYLLIASCVLSALFNVGPAAGAVMVITKYMFLATMTVAAYDVFTRHKAGDVFLAVLSVYAAPMALLALSIVTGLGKGNEEKPGDISFIGGYYHEAAFSVVVLTVLMAACLIDLKRNRIALPAILLSTAGLAFVNYRTALIAALPLVVAALYFRSIRRFAPPERVLISVILVAVGGVGLIAIVMHVQERFQDVFTVLQHSAELMKPPEHFTDDERHLFSSRVFIWAGYLSAYAAGDLRNALFGFGPEAWAKTMPLYAHNTFIGTLYDFGLFGLIAVTCLFIQNIGASFRIGGPMRPLMIAALGSFLVLNLATMPLWIIEGNILLSLLLGSTWAASRKRPSLHPAVAVSELARGARPLPTGAGFMHHAG